MKSFLFAVTIEISPPYKISALSNIKVHTEILSTVLSGSYTHEKVMDCSSRGNSLL